VSAAQAKKLRSNMTDAERRLWYHLRAHRFGGLKFKRQVPIGPYVVDFACVGRRLVLEIDGGQHVDSVSDRSRDEFLRSRGFQVLRFWNNDVLSNTNGVLEVVLAQLTTSDSSTPSPGALRAPPSPLRREGKNPPSRQTSRR
jgi:very-short-patch-repair endonuclease